MSNVTSDEINQMLNIHAALARAESRSRLLLECGEEWSKDDLESWEIAQIQARELADEFSSQILGKAVAILNAAKMGLES